MAQSRLMTIGAAGLIAGLALPTTATAQADNAAALAELDASLPGALINDPTSLAWNTQGEGLEVDSLTDGGIPGGGAAASFDVRRPGDDPWSVQVYVPLTAGIDEGEVVTFGFWARAAEPSEGSDNGQVSVRIQNNVDPWPGFGDTQLAILPEWEWYEVSTTATRDISERDGVLVFQLGGARQKIEIGQTIVVKDADRIMAESATPAVPLPPQIEGKGRLVNQPDSREWTFFGPEGSATPREDGTIYLGRAVQFVSSTVGTNIWDIHANVPLTEVIKTGDKLLIAVAAKTVSAATDDGKALVGVRVQQNHEPYDGFADNRFKVGPNWQLIQIRTTAAMDLPAGAGLVVLQFAGAEQTVDLGPVYVLKEPPAP